MRLASIQLLIQQCEEQIKFAERPSRINSLKLLEVAKDHAFILAGRPLHKEVEDLCACKDLSHLMKEGDHGFCLKCEKPYIPAQDLT
jgi:hypothetical protein